MHPLLSACDMGEVMAPVPVFHAVPHVQLKLNVLASFAGSARASAKSDKADL